MYIISSTGRVDHFKTTGRRNAVFNTDGHCQECVSILNAIEKQFLYYEIGCLYFSGLRYDYHPMHNFSKSFRHSIAKLDDTNVIRKEIAYVKCCSDYHKFLRSPLYETIKTKFTHFLTAGTHCDISQRYYVIGNITGLNISRPKEESCEPDTGFKFKLSTDFYDSDYNLGGYDQITLSDGVYRSLSYRELSLLTVALIEDFPEYFDVKWNLGVVSETVSMFGGLKEKTLYNIAVYFHPKFKTGFHPITTNNTVLKDIY